jgi:ribosomal protein S18 acetylase RimI-like enzyme
MTPIFVSVDKDNVVKGYGFAQINNIGGEDNLHSYSNIYIDDICVDEAFRQQGVAMEIYKFIEGYAEGMGCHNITLNVWEGNDSARRFYESMGMGIQKTVMEKII